MGDFADEFSGAIEKLRRLNVDACPARVERGPDLELLTKRVLRRSLRLNSNASVELSRLHIAALPIPKHHDTLGIE
jgi:hypothetical protein